MAAYFEFYNNDPDGNNSVWLVKARNLHDAEAKLRASVDISGQLKPKFISYADAQILLDNFASDPVEFEERLASRDVFKISEDFKKSSSWLSRELELSKIPLRDKFGKIVKDENGEVVMVYEKIL